MTEIWTDVEGISPEAMQELEGLLRQEGDLVELNAALSGVQKQVQRAMALQREAEEKQAREERLAAKNERIEELAQTILTPEEAMATLKQQYLRHDTYKVPEWEDVKKRITPEHIELVRGLIDPKVFKIDPIRGWMHVTDGVEHMPDYLAGPYPELRQAATDAGYRLMGAKEYFNKFNRQGQYDHHTVLGTWVESGENMSEERKADDWLDCQPGAAMTMVSMREGEYPTPMLTSIDEDIPARRVVDIPILDEVSGTKGAVIRTLRRLKYKQLAPAA